MDPRALSVGLVTLGCPKNLVDSELVLGKVLEAGFRLAPSVESCDIAIVNTCSFIQDAKKEAVREVLDLAEAKREGRIKGLIVIGCLAQRYATEMKAELPEVDAFLGTGDFPKIIEVIGKVAGGEKLSLVSNPVFLYEGEEPRVALSKPHSRFIKIAEGCNHACSFCIIPRLRGRYRSRSVESVREEAVRLIAEGARELNLIAQDLTYFGMDTEGRPLLSELVRELDGLAGLGWLRLFYLYPNMVSEELVRAIKDSAHVCRYLDIPLQHASDPVLSAMRRGMDSARAEALIDRLRKAMPDAVIRSSFIVGFPGETEADFKRLLSFVRRMRFDKVGVFTYSDEEGTFAHELPNKVPAKVKRERRAELMELQQGISQKIHAGLVGRSLETMVDEVSTNCKPSIGRTRRDGVGIDGKMFFKAPSASRPGDILNVRITQADIYDLKGEVA